MAIEYFLKLDGIKGEALASKHKDEIELHSFSWGASNPTTVHGSGLSAGKVAIHDFTVSKPVDKASAKLLEMCCSGKHIKDGYLYCAKSTGDKHPGDYLTIKFEQVHVAGWSTGGSHGDAIGVESVTFAFGKFELDYKIQDDKGNLTAAGNAKYDITKREIS